MLTTLKVNERLALPPDQTVSEWSAENVFIPEGNRLVGIIGFDDLRYQPEIMDMAVNRKCRRISVMSAAQAGKTQIALCLALFAVGHSPKNVIILQPTENDARVFLASKFDTALRANRQLQDCFVSRRSTEGVYNSTYRDFAGGALMLSWSKGLSTLRGRTAHWTISDEVSAMANTAEGFPADLIAERSATFGSERLNVEMSTPTISGACRIESQFQLGDGRVWQLRCIDCQELQAPAFEHLREKDGTIYYVCFHCGREHQEYERNEAIRQGEWVASREFTNHASFHISGIASPLRSLKDIVDTHQNLINAGKPINHFVNTVLGEPYVAEKESAEDLTLQDRLEDFGATLPADTKVLTAAVDVQMNRLEVGVYAWHGQTWNACVDYRVLSGDPAGSSVWKDLERLLLTDYARPDEKRQQIAIVGIDSKFMTEEVETFISQYRSRSRKIGQSVYALKGVNAMKNPNILQRSTSRYRIGKLMMNEIININSHASKMQAMRMLHVDNPEVAGYCRFSHFLDQEFFDALTAEELVTELDSRGFPRISWRLIRERNESFDIFRYNYAMALMGNVFNDDTEPMNIVGKSGLKRPRKFT